MEHNLFRGSSVCACLRHISLWKLKIPTNQWTSWTLVGASMASMSSTLENMGLTRYLLNQNIRYLVSVHPNKTFSVFTFNTSSNILWKTFYIAFKWSIKYCLVITSTFSLYSRTISNLLKSSDIFSWKIKGLLNNPIGSFGTCYFPTGVQ